MLRERLVRRGVTVSAVGMGMALATKASAGVLPGFVATAHQAAVAVAAGQAAAPSALAAMLSKGVLHMLWLEQVRKVALVAAALLVGGAGVATYVGAADRAAAPVAPAPADWPKLQTEALAKKLDVSYQRAYLGEVLTDLKRRGGLRIAAPASIRRTVLVTLELKGVTGKDVLEKLAAEGKLRVEYLPGLAVVTQPADAAALTNLAAKLADRGSQVRSEAVWDLAAMGDRQVTPILVNAVTDKDEMVEEWAVRGLGRHTQMLPLLADAQKVALTDALKTQIEDAAAPGATQETARNLDEKIRRLVKLLAATEHPQAQKILANWANGGGKHTELQLAALFGLSESGAPDAVAVLIDIYHKNLAIEQKEIEAKVMGATPAHRAVGYALTALVRCPAPEAVAFINQEAAKSPYAKALLTLQGAPGNQADEDSLAIFLSPKAIEDAKATLAQSAGKGAAAVDIPALRGALMVLAQVNNAGAEDLVVKVINDPELMKNLARGGGIMPLTFNAATSPTVRDALLVQLGAAASNKPLQLLLVRSLGTSHAKAAADALLKLLNDADTPLRAQAAQALAQTGDDRAAEAIAALLRTPAAKLSWPKADPKGPGPDPRKNAVSALANSRNAQAMELLLGLTEAKDIDAETRDLALRVLPEAILDDAQLAAFAAGLAKMAPEVQRSIVLLSGGFTGGSPALVAPYWGDPRVLAVIVARAHDKEAFHLDHGGKKVNNFAVMRLSQAENPRAAAALAKLSKDADADLAALANRAFEAAYAP